MGSVPEYREYARRCLEIADKTPQQRILLLEMARVWQERDQERQKRDGNTVGTERTA
jgi:hypothetical protein